MLAMLLPLKPGHSYVGQVNTLLVAFLEQQGYTVTALITFNLAQDNEVMEEELIRSYH